MNRNAVCIALVGLLMLSLLAGCKGEVVEATEPAAGGQRLHITGTVTDDHMRKEYLIPGTERGVRVYYFEDATVEIDGQPVSLQAAVEQEKLMPEEIAAMARLDAVDGYCKMTATSDKGLAGFLYVYPEQFALRTVNDILETPDGKQHHIELVEVYAPNRSAGSGTYVFYDDENTPLAQEDWGVSLTVEDATPTGATLVCTQAGGGQQVGTLILESFTLYRVETNEFIHKQDDTIGHAIGGEAVAIEENTTGRVALDWSETFGQLPSGEYIMQVTVLDEFDENELHPLMVKYQYHQDHRIEFTIP